jgi:hypothetical protein
MFLKSHIAKLTVHRFVQAYETVIILVIDDIENLSTLSAMQRYNLIMTHKS